MKKLLSVFLLLLTFCISLVGVKPIRKKALAETAGIEPKSKAVYLMDYNSGTVILSQNEKEHLPIASMCKIMTLLLCFEELDAGNIALDEVITVSENAAGMGGSQVFLDANKPYVIGELIKSITVASANDASVAMAERICGSEEAFVDKMNAKCAELGMENTCFSNCTGLPKAGQYSCAQDVATMFKNLLSHKEYFNYSKIWMDEIKHDGGRVTGISNTNKLIRFYDGCDGGKTGYTSEAGHCLAASAIRKGMRLVCVVIKSPDSKTRFNDVTSMFNYGFANFENKLILDEDSPMDISVNVERGKCDSVKIMPEKSFYLFCKKNEKVALDVDFTPESKVKAPIEKGECVGKLSIFKDNVLIGEVNAVASEAVNKITYFDAIKNIIDNWAI